MYRLPQAGMLANNLLNERLEIHGYFEVPHMPGLLAHKTRPIWFTLVVDNFGINYIGKEYADHLLSVLSQDYNVEVDWEGSLYCGMSLDWIYKKQFLDVSMLKYV